MSSRHLYDDGVLLEVCGSLSGLVPAATARANPYDFDRLGVATGDAVRVRSGRGSLVVEALADAGVPRGVLCVGFNLDSGRRTGTTGGGAAGALIRSGEMVVDVRLETLPAGDGGGGA